MWVPGILPIKGHFLKGNLELKGQKAMEQSKVDAGRVSEEYNSLVSEKAILHEIRASIDLEQSQSEGPCDFLVDNLAGEEKKINSEGGFGMRDWNLRSPSLHTVSHTFKLNTLEEEAARSLDMGIAWST